MQDVITIVHVFYGLTVPFNTFQLCHAGSLRLSAARNDFGLAHSSIGLRWWDETAPERQPQDARTILRTMPQSP